MARIARPEELTIQTCQHASLRIRSRQRDSWQRQAQMLRQLLLPIRPMGPQVIFLCLIMMLHRWRSQGSEINATSKSWISSIKQIRMVAMMIIRQIALVLRSRECARWNLTISKLTWIETLQKLEEPKTKSSMEAAKTSLWHLMNQILTIWMVLVRFHQARAPDDRGPRTMHHKRNCLALVITYRSSIWAPKLPKNQFKRKKEQKSCLKPWADPACLGVNLIAIRRTLAGPSPRRRFLIGTSWWWTRWKTMLWKFTMEMILQWWQLKLIKCNKSVPTWTLGWRRWIPRSPATASKRVTNQFWCLGPLLHIWTPTEQAQTLFTIKRCQLVPVHAAGWNQTRDYREIADDQIKQWVQVAIMTL